MKKEEWKGMLEKTRKWMEGLGWTFKETEKKENGKR